MKVWCVQHKDGWCATADGKEPARGHEMSVPTLCKHYVILAWAFEKREPGCPACRTALASPKQEGPARG